ncbi:hypothetical protein HanRHA438_Chr17g0827941 [Helianthus annuus]|nr:hypothetical protein HanRHA438_Chr17g0827941 [Helianthus annuus]
MLLVATDLNIDMLFENDQMLIFCLKSSTFENMPYVTSMWYVYSKRDIFRKYTYKNQFASLFF